MSLEEFLRIFEQILNEFLILNEYFDVKTFSRTIDYNDVFYKWSKDMGKRYSNITLDIRWATSAPLIYRNQLYFSGRYRDDYFCEVKYVFSEDYVKDIRKRYCHYIDTIKFIKDDFKKFDGQQIEKGTNSINDYEKEFLEWKNEVSKKYKDVAIDIIWAGRSERISNNRIFLNVFFKDEFLLQMKYIPLQSKEKDTYISMDEYLDYV